MMPNAFSIEFYILGTIQMPKLTRRFVIAIILFSLGTHAFSIAQTSHIIDRNSIQSKKESEGRIAVAAAAPNRYPAEFPDKSYQLAEINFDPEKGPSENVKKSMRTFITMHPSGKFEYQASSLCLETKDRRRSDKEGKSNLSIATAQLRAVFAENNEIFSISPVDKSSPLCNERGFNKSNAGPVRASIIRSYLPLPFLVRLLEWKLNK